MFWLFEDHAHSPKPLEVVDADVGLDLRKHVGEVLLLHWIDVKLLWYILKKTYLSE